MNNKKFNKHLKKNNPIPILTILLIGFLLLALGVLFNISLIIGTACMMFLIGLYRGGFFKIDEEVEK